jgi:signal transduction histidine kinase
MREQLRRVPLFADLPGEDLDRLASGVENVELAAGDQLFAEGDAGDAAFVVATGSLEVVKITGDRNVLLAVRREGEVIGEMALLDPAPRLATVRARDAARLLRIPRHEVEELLGSSATAARSLFGVLLARWRETEERFRRSERMAQLGTLTAGLAHELNNPAAAVKRGADQLGSAMAAYALAIGDVAARGLDPWRDDRLSPLRGEAGERAALSALERSDREGEIEDVLDAAGVVDDPWRLAPDLVAAGFDAAMVREVLDEFAEASGEVLRAHAAAETAHTLLSEVEEGAARLSGIVAALKSYSYMDQAPLQEVDLHRGLEDTLLILKRKLGDIEVKREYGRLPPIPAFANELNQVWTNLIDNAADALQSVEGGTITLRTYRGEGDTAVVEVEDDGPGIPEDVLPRVFDSFFTTKPLGAGTGLGLDISFGIVVHKHRGEITAASEPGRTVFRVVLPLERPG